MAEKIYIQIKEVDWLGTPKHTVYILTPKSVLGKKSVHIPFITPKDESLRHTLFGVRYDVHKDLFIEVEE
jgi:hypothetical protein